MNRRTVLSGVALSLSGCLSRASDRDPDDRYYRLGEVVATDRDWEVSIDDWTTSDAYTTDLFGDKEVSDGDVYMFVSVSVRNTATTSRNEYLKTAVFRPVRTGDISSLTTYLVPPEEYILPNRRRLPNYRHAVSEYGEDRVIRIPPDARISGWILFTVPGDFDSAKLRFRASLDSKNHFWAAE